jgi:transcriptional regulator with XRE-family HTH domain
MHAKIAAVVGSRIRQARTTRNLSLNDVATRAHISVATLSRIERDKQRLELGLFVLLCRILKTPPEDLLGEEYPENVDPLAVRIASLQLADRVQLWRDLASSRRGEQRSSMRMQVLAEEVEELLAQIEFVRAEMESLHTRVRRR